VTVEQGERRFGKYTLLEKIGSGGMAEIWRASLAGVDGFQKILVVKKILPKYANNQQFITMFVQEAKVCAGLQHANLVQIYELGEVEGEYFIGMEYVQGYDLLKVLTQASKTKTPIPSDLTLYIIREVCKGLAHAHDATDLNGNPLNIIHLDVSPSNVLISSDGDVKLTDFGVARASVAEGTDRDDRLKGKLGYMSPEQVTGKPLDHRSDIFSVGIMLYEIFTLKRLFLGKSDIETLSNVREADVESRLARHPEIPEEIADVLRRALKRNVDTRYQTALEIEDAVSLYLFEQRQRVSPKTLATFLTQLFDSGETPTDALEPDTESEAGDEIRPIVRHDTALKRRPAGMSLPQHGVSYRFRTADGAIFGPVAENNLESLLRSGAVSAEELVSLNGGPWLSVSDVPELVVKVPSELFDHGSKPDEEDDFGFRNAARLMTYNVSHKRTGRVRIRHNGYVKDIFFRSGKPVHITSNQKSELFGSMLVDSKQISAEQLAAAMSSMGDHNGPLGTLLVKKGFLAGSDLYPLLQKQFRQKFLTVFSISKGTYEYFDGHPPDPSVVPMPLKTLPLITEGVRTYVSDDFIANYFSTAGKRRVRLVANRPFDPTLLQFTPREARVQNLVASRPASFDTIMQSSANNEAQARVARFVLFLLHQTEQIQIR
jgi:serine/threonine protein kinase